MIDLNTQLSAAPARVESEKAKHPEMSFYQLEMTFPDRRAAVVDVLTMNKRMKIVGAELLPIAKSNEQVD